MERERKGRGWREREEARQRRRARGGGGGEPAEGMQEEEAPKVEEEADVWAPHVSEYWERSNRGILDHTKIRGSASGSKGIKDV